MTYHVPHNYPHAVATGASVELTYEELEQALAVAENSRRRWKFLCSCLFILAVACAATVLRICWLLMEATR